MKPDRDVHVRTGARRSGEGGDDLATDRFGTLSLTRVSLLKFSIRGGKENEKATICYGDRCAADHGLWR